MNRPFNIRGRIQSLPDMSDYGIRLTLHPLAISQEGKEFVFKKEIILYLPDGSISEKKSLPKSLFIGDIIEFRGKLERPPYNLIPGVRDRRLSAELSGEPFIVRLKSPLQIRKTYPPSKPLSTIFSYLENLIDFAEENNSPETTALLRSLLLGQKSALPVEFRERLNRLGTAHLFVISGFHVGVILGLLHLLLKGRKQILSLLITPSMIWGYVWLLGFPIPAFRAAVLASVYLLLLQLGVRRKPLNALGIAALCLLVFNPSAVYLPGFQLTYLCLLAIIWLFLPLAKLINAPVKGYRLFLENRVLTGCSAELSRLRRSRAWFDIKFRHLPDKAKEAIRISLPGISWPLKILACTGSIQFFLFPVLLYFFNCFNYYSLLTNLLLVPLISLAVVNGTLLFATFWTPAAAFLYNCYQINGSLISLAIFRLDSLFTPAYCPHPSIPQLLGYYLFLLTMLAVNPRKGWIFPLLLLAIFISWNNLPAGPKTASGKLEITMLDVGQGDCFHLRYPDGGNALIDAGGTSFEGNETYLGKSLIGRYLWHRDVRNLDYILISHPDKDHLAGYSFLKQAFPVRNTYHYDYHPSYEKSATKLSSGDFFVIEGVHHQVIWPKDGTGKEKSLNDRSLVILLTYGHFRILFTGDISGETEKQLIKEYSLEGTTILKAAHHGSNSSTSRLFLRKLHPEYALVSAGRRNPFNHPSPKVLERLEEAGIKTFCTAESGTMKIVADGFSWEVIPACLQ